MTIAALYEACKTQNPDADRIDAYLALKERIRVAVERRIREGGSRAAEVLGTRELLH